MQNNPDGTPGLNKFARVITGRAQQVKDNGDGLILDIGLIQSDLSLLPNTFPYKIPKTDYHVCRLVNGFEYEIDETDAEEYHTHMAKPPALKEGDRVLIAWVQKEVVVIDVIDAAE